MNTGEYKEFSISTAEGRKELKEIFCGLGYEIIHAIDQMEEELYWDEFVSKANPPG